MKEESQDLLDNTPDTRIQLEEEETDNRFTYLAIIVVILCFIGFFIGLYAAFY